MADVAVGQPPVILLLFLIDVINWFNGFLRGWIQKILHGEGEGVKRGRGGGGEGEGGGGGGVYLLAISFLLRVRFTWLCLIGFIY